MREPVRMAVRVEGVVQGVGFRPFVYSLAARFGLTGHVGNDVRGVFAEIEGDRAAAEKFLHAVVDEVPALAVVDRVDSHEVSARGDTEFAIVSSPGTGTAATLVSADSATCDDCLAELFDPADRRYRYPFVNCTNCGPRFTIVRGVPYDRPLTTMSEFPLCAECAYEYADPLDRRFHAQPVCCPRCGPRLALLDAEGKPTADDPLTTAVRWLDSGEVLAIKGLGGYHLAVDAMDESAAAALRSRKHREDKPFAVMVADLAEARRLCHVDACAAELLTDRRRPVVLLPRVPRAAVAPAVAPGNRRLGVMLPYTPLHHLLLGDLGRPLVMTSANVSDEPIVHRDEAVVDRLSGIADGYLTHDRAIHTRADDSVVRPFRGRAQLQRRARGYAPEPVTVQPRFDRPVLACGAELKNTFCLGRGGHAFVSQHIGDLENHETLRCFTDGIAHYRELFDIDPGIVAHDLHPEYLSTKYARALRRVEHVGVQHHHAHIASCLADNGEAGPVIGVAFDGLGYGTDGTIWGGEFLLADLIGYRRLGHLRPIPMPGGTAAIKQPWRMAAAYLDGDGAPPPDLDVVRRNERQWHDVASLARSGVNSPSTSSAGRLFDAVAALLGVRDEIHYEGQAAVELEQRADLDEEGDYRAAVTESEPFVVSGVDMVRACVEDLRSGIDVSRIAARFHNGVAGAIARGCARAEAETGVRVVALSGGVFQNLLLLERTVEALRGLGFRVLVHSRVPSNDAGISLGQAVVAAHRTRSHS